VVTVQDPERLSERPHADHLSAAELPEQLPHCRCASYQVNDTLTARAGFGFDKTPITDAYRTVRVPDQNRLILAAGLTYRLMPNSAIDLGYAHMFMMNASLREASVTSDVLAGSTSSALDVIVLETRLSSESLSRINSLRIEGWKSAS
jgi:hypothetical protein